MAQGNQHNAFFHLVWVEELLRNVLTTLIRMETFGAQLRQIQIPQNTLEVMVIGASVMMVYVQSIPKQVFVEIQFSSS